jgi:uncharacterized protein (DUF1697 family)
MKTYIALFRGINVGGRNILPMKDLVLILESLGHENVKTYIQSGNVIFQNKHTIGLKDTIEISNEIHRKMGFEPKVIIINLIQFSESIKRNPFPIDNGKILHFFFLESKPKTPAIEKLESLKTESEEFALIENVYYLYAPDGIGRSKLAAASEKLLGVTITARNLNTVNKLAAMITNLE